MSSRARDAERVDQLVQLATVLEEQHGKVCEFGEVRNVHGHPISLWTGNESSGVPVKVRCIREKGSKAWTFYRPGGPAQLPRVLGQSDDLDAVAEHIVKILDRLADRLQAHDT